jgi:hypothetical protein
MEVVSYLSIAEKCATKACTPELMVPTSHLPPAVSTVSSLCICSYFYISAACILYKWILAQISRPKAANHAQPPGESTGAQEYEIPILSVFGPPFFLNKKPIKVVERDRLSNLWFRLHVVISACLFPCALWKRRDDRWSSGESPAGEIIARGYHFWVVAILIP